MGYCVRCQETHHGNRWLYYDGFSYKYKYRFILKDMGLHPTEIKGYSAEDHAVCTKIFAKNVPIKNVKLSTIIFVELKNKKEAIHIVQMIKKIAIRDKLEIYNIQIKKCKDYENERN